MNQHRLRIVRKHEVLERRGCSKATLHNDINKGVWLEPFSLGPRSVGWLESELDAMLQARAAGMTEAEIKSLVNRLLARRKQLRAHIEQTLAEDSGLDNIAACG